MKKRYFLASGLALFYGSAFSQTLNQRTNQYPIGWATEDLQNELTIPLSHRVGNFSGGIESMFRFNTISPTKVFKDPIPITKSIDSSLITKAQKYALENNRTSLLVAKENQIVYEEYFKDRTWKMRFFGWSMTKSIVGLLVGIALDDGKIKSIDDRLEQYISELKTHDFGSLKLRNLMNMTSGIDICQVWCKPQNEFERFGYSQIGFPGQRGRGTDQVQGILNFKWALNTPQGSKFNYLDINAMLIAWALESAYQMPLHKITEMLLWKPLGARQQATWLTDEKGFTFSGAGFSATAQDWIRLGMMVANGGWFNDRQIVSKKWIDEISSLTELDQASKFNVARPNRAYKNFFWHHSSTGQQLRMAGNFSQNILVDRLTQTVVLETGVSYEGHDIEKLDQVFKYACNI